MDFFGGVELGPLSFTCLAAGASIASGVTAHLLAGPAHRIGLVSRRRRDRFGAGRVPLTGGPGLAAGMLLALLVLRVAPRTGEIVAATGLFGVGLLDDLLELRPLAKLGLQTAVCAVAVGLLLPSFAYAGLALLLLLLLANASNYLDNMDGLLPGVALTQAVALLLFSLVAGPGASLLVWALPGVLLLTLPPARLYLGDSGSLLVGGLLALDALRILIDLEGLQPRYFLPLALVFAVPLVDFATVTASRIRRRRPLLRGGTDHLSHRLVRLGFPVPRAVLVLVLASGVCGLASLLLVHAS